jgi:beta-lactamase superfamily II metal-dependent hydrolase
MIYWVVPKVYADKSYNKQKGGAHWNFTGGFCCSMPLYLAGFRRSRGASLAPKSLGNLCGFVPPVFSATPTRGGVKYFLGKQEVIKKMNYEIDFIGVSEETGDADAICFRYYDDKHGRYRVFVYDGGTQNYGEALKEHLNKYYFSDVRNPVIDAIICSHPDQDHASGLSVILENFTVKRLYMNRPWLYVDEIFDRVADGRITTQSLEERLRKAYPYVDTLEKLADERRVSIKTVFQGTAITDNLYIFSPNKDFFLEKLVASQKTPLTENSSGLEAMFSRITKGIQAAFESWTQELLREDVETSAENEMSVVLLGDMEQELFLLTGDAGIEGLKETINHADSLNWDIKKVSFYQIPHHGGRHNVSPSVLNRMIGKKLPEGTRLPKSAYVSVAKNSDHPKKMVVNAFIRRGVKVFKTNGCTLHHFMGTPPRNWSL